MAEISIPGSPGGLQSLVSQLRTAAASVAAVQDRVASNGLHGSWSGQASDAFRSTLHEFPGELGPIVTAFGDAGQALAAFAGRLEQLQEQARWCEGQMENAQQELRAANARHAAAQTKLSAARLAHSAAADPVSLHTAQSAVNLGENLVRQAGADIEDIGSAVARLRSQAQAILNEYEDVVRACASSLDSARHAGGRSLTGWIGSHVGRLLGHAERDLAVWWRYGDRVVDEAEDLVDVPSHVHDAFDTLGFFVLNSPVSRLRGADVPIVRLVENPLFKHIGSGFAILGAVGNLQTAWGDSSGETPDGYEITLGTSMASDYALYAYAPLGAANFLDGGAVRADLRAFGAMGGAGVSGAERGLDAAYAADRADRESGNYLGLAVHVAAGGAGGAAHGVSKGLDTWSDDVAQGKYGGFLKGFDDLETKAITNPGGTAKTVAKDLVTKPAGTLWDVVRTVVL